MTFDIKQMLDPDVFMHPVSHIKLIETHISWVILTGKIAYKIKKPVNFGFLDFSTLEKRKQCCEQELALNRRLAPDIYLNVVSIIKSENKLIVSDTGTAIEYAVKMQQFPQTAQLDNRLAAGQLTLENIEAFARMIADFHQTTEIADNTMAYGNSEMVNKAVVENFSQIAQHLKINTYEKTLAILSHWSETQALQLQHIFSQRKQDGFVRQCHGDMHLQNMLWHNDTAMAFDCIEFNPELSWIDVMNEIAFLVMDCQHRQQLQLANRCLNSYLEITGDYNGIIVLPYYLCYRAMVRAKVNVLRLAQADVSEEEKKQACLEFESYINLANRYIEATAVKIIIMRGLSASGKSTISQQLVDRLGAIRIRSDMERKRMFGITKNTEEAVDSGIYNEQSSQQTYDRLTSLASDVISAGYSVIIDAAFLKHEQRSCFQRLAERLSVPFVILEVSAPTEILRQRIVQRKNDISDANLAVLEHQLRNFEGLHSDEQSKVIAINTEKTVDIDTLIKRIEGFE